MRFPTYNVPQALAECKELRQTITQHSAIIRAVERECDLAIATLGRHGLTEQYHMDCQKEMAVGEASVGHVTDPRDHMIQQLSRQKEELHQVIKQMRQEMEQLTNWSDHGVDGKVHGISESKADTGLVTTGYVKFLEKELSRLKSENRQLDEKMQERKKPPTPPSSSGERQRLSPSLALERRHRSHLIALSDTIASLQRERQGLEGEVRRLQGEVERKEERLVALGEQVGGVNMLHVPDRAA